MAYKHCYDSYRIKDGVKYRQWEDAELSNYKNVVAQLRAEGYRAFAVRFNDEGFARVFREVK